MNRKESLWTFVIQLFSGALVFVVIHVAAYGVRLVSRSLPETGGSGWILTFLTWSSLAIDVSAYIILVAIIAGSLFNLRDNLQSIKGGSRG